MINRKGIGFLGLGSKSTCYYMQEMANLMLICESHVPVKMIQAKFDEINNHLPHQFDVLEPIVTHYLEELESMDVDCFLIPNITLHETIDRLKWKNTRLIHPLKETLNELKKDGIDEACIFATVHTMNGKYIADFFNAHGVKIVKPIQSDIAIIDTLRVSIYQNGLTDSSMNQLEMLALKYTNEMAVVIGCTELSMAFQKSNIPKLYDSARLQLKGAFFQ